MHSSRGEQNTAGPRTQAQRDAITVEIAFSVVSGGLVAALLFLLIAGPALLGDLGQTAEARLRVAAGLAAAVGSRSARAASSADCAPPCADRPPGRAAPGPTCSRHAPRRHGDLIFLVITRRG
ncbi:hypothetical protein GCM10027168_14000 [Streptomyces capparidis]